MTARGRIAVAATVAVTGLGAGVVAAPSTAAVRPAAGAGESARATISKEPFGVTAGGRRVDRYTLTNSHGMQMKVLTFGGVIQKLRVPDRDGHLRNVVLGFDHLADYEADTDPYFGALIGRHGNRIANGRFTLVGPTYRLPDRKSGGW